MGSATRASRLLILTCVFALATAALALDTVSAESAGHAPIRIEGDADLTPANGVVSGSGTALDPFVIQGWRIVAKSADGIVVRNTSAPFVIRGVTIESGGLDHDGIVLENVSSATVEDSVMSHDASGIIVRASTDVVMRGNSVTQNAWDGIAIFDSRRVTLTANNVTYNRDGAYVQATSELLLRGNAFWLNAQDGAFLTNVTAVDVGASTFSSNGWIGAHVSGASRMTFAGNLVFSNGRDGISVDNAFDLEIRSNTAFSNQGEGIRLYRVSTTRLTLNDLSANRDSGILVESSDALSIATNVVSGSGYGGIVVGSVTGLVIEGNRVSNSDYGISMILASESTLRANNVTLSRENGFFLAGCDNVTLEGNNASRNANGISIDSTVDGAVRGNGILQNGYGIALLRSIRIVIAGNRILQNDVQAFDEAGAVNRWDDGYPAGGNFWSDYSGPDRCEGGTQSMCDDPDGLGDRPYDIDTDSADRYPLVRPPGSPDAAPVSSFVIEPNAGNTSTAFAFDATSAYDIEDSASTLELRWDFDGDGTWDTPWTHERIASYAFPAAGEYRPRLEVRDSRGHADISVGLLSVGIAPGPAPWIVLSPLGAAIFLLAGTTVAVAILSFYRMRWRIRRVLAMKLTNLRGRGRV